MSLKIVTAPALEPISLDEAKLHLRVDLDDATEDALINSLITTARQYCEGYQRRNYITQTWELWLDDFPPLIYINIPLPPLQSVTHVKYYGTDDTEYTFSSDDYFVDTKSEPGRVSLGYIKQWPSTTLRPVNGVCVTFVAGYGDADTDIPQSVKQAMLLLIAAWYEQREAFTTSGINISVVPMAVDALLWLDRIF